MRWKILILCYKSTSKTGKKERRQILDTLSRTKDTSIQRSVNDTKRGSHIVKIWQNYAEIKRKRQNLWRLWQAVVTIIR